MKNLTIFEKRVIFWAFVVHIIAAWFSVGFHHPDEHFQIIEFANYKLGKTPLDKLAWEFPAKIRPGLQPLMAYALLRPYYALGFKDPYIFAFILRLISGFMCIFTAFSFHKAVVSQIKSTYLQNVHFIISLLGWSLVYLHVRFSSENWSAIAFAWAIIFLWQKNKASYWLFGIMAGLSFVFRFQTCFMLAGAGLWMIIIDKTSWQNILKVIGGFITIFAFGLLCEYWLYGQFTISSLSYVVENIIHNKAAQFGVEPWYWYFDQIFNQNIPPFSIIVLFSIPIMIWYYPKHILTWMMAFFLLGHIVVAHKEFRFLFPLAFFVPFWSLATIEVLETKLVKVTQAHWYIKSKNVFRIGFWIANTFALILMITKPANDIIAVNKALYYHLKQRTIIFYSFDYNPYINSDTCGATFYNNSLISSHCIDEFINDTSLLKGKNILLFSEHAYPKDEFMFQYGGSFFDSSRSELIYARFPKWVYHFNFNNWLERSNPYTIYQLHEKPIH